MGAGRDHITGIILAGGKSRRMGRPKSLISWRGQPLIMEVSRRLGLITDKLLLVTDEPGRYPFLDIPKVPDLFVNRGPMGGLHSGLHHAETPWMILTACDQPFLDPGLLGLLASYADRTGIDAVVPSLPGGYIEPLCALYSRDILPGLTRWLEQEERSSLRDFLPTINCHYLPPGEWEAFGPPERLFFNMNTPADLKRAQTMFDGDKEDHAPGC